MKQASPLQAVGFGFTYFFKKFFFFIGVVLVSLSTSIVGFIASLILTIPFLFPLLKVAKQFSSLMGTFMGKSDPQIALIQIKEFIGHLFSNGIFTIFTLGIGIIFILTLNIMIYNYLMLGITKISIEIYDQGHSSLGSLFSGLSKFFKYFAATILYSLIYWVGFILAFFLGSSISGISLHISIYLILGLGLGLLIFSPFIYWTIKFWFYAYFIADKDMRPIEAFKQSYNIKGGFKTTFLMLLLFLVLYIFFGFIISFMFSMPIIALILQIFLHFSMFSIPLAGAFLYRHLTIKE